MFSISLVLRAAHLLALVLMNDPLSRSVILLSILIETGFYAHALKRVTDVVAKRRQTFRRTFELQKDEHLLPLFGLLVTTSSVLVTFAFLMAGWLYAIGLTIFAFSQLCIAAVLISELRNAQSV